MDATRTPIDNIDKKNDVIEHVNEDHQSEILSIIHGYTALKLADSATLIDIFQEGILIMITTPSGSEERFIPFLLKGDLEENILYLAYSAMVKQGESPINNKKQYFEVLKTTMVSPNMIRIIVKSKTALPERLPGYAYLLALKKLEKMPKKIRQSPAKLSKIKQWLYQILLWRVKNMSSQERLNRMLAFAKGTRYYTLRKSYKSTSDASFLDLGYIDVFLHGDTPGGLWAQDLNKGDIIHSVSEVAEHCDHLNQGQAILIADETSLPTIATLLENWQNPIAPYIISITHNDADQAYLPDEMVPERHKLFRISALNVSQTVINLMQSMPQIDATWGAIENVDARAIRKYLKEERNLSNTHNRVKAYWRKTLPQTQEPPPDA